MFTTRHARLRFIVDPAEEPGGGGGGQQDPDAEAEAGDPDEGEEPEEGDDEPFDAARAHAKIRKANAEAAALRKRTKDAEAKAAGSDEKDKRISALEAEKLRIRIGYRNSLPDELIDRLQGTTEEEILADAEKLLGALTNGRKTTTQRPKEALRGGGRPEEEPEETDPRKLAALVPRR
jgi:hypothetical protein